MENYQYTLIAIAILIFLSVLTLVLKALLIKKKAKISTGKRVRASTEELEIYVKKLGKMIQCKTIAKIGDKEYNAEEFEKFRNILKENFPLLHKKAELKMFNNCLIYKISGKNATKNIMLMSHHDVVEGDGEWKHDPFLGEVVGDVLWGRGTVDTKTPLFAEMQAAEELLQEGHDFEGFNLYIGSSGNEEIAGDGIPLSVEYFKEKNIEFDVVVDEGGAIISGMMPGVKQKSAMVAVHEKGRHGFICKTESTDKGHSGFKVTKTNPIERMSAFITKIKNTKIAKAEFVEEVEDMFKAHAPYMNFPLRWLFANMSVFKKLLLKVLPTVSGEVEGMLKTTYNFTSIVGGKHEQIQAKEVEANLFLRCVREEHLKGELEKIQKIAKKYKISITPSVVEYCKPSSSQSPQFKLLEETLNKIFPDVIVSPYLLTAGTDARHFSDISKSILRFAPIDLSPEQFKSVHNINENIDVVNIGESVKFYKQFIKHYK